MDLVECLKTLTDNVVKKQIDSLESMNRLCRMTDTVSSDISNLINRLQMVGNRQFAENRVQDDDPLIGGDQLQQQQHTKDTCSSVGPQVRAHNGEEVLKLSSILLKAIELLPATDDDDGDQADLDLAHDDGEHLGLPVTDLGANEKLGYVQVVNDIEKKQVVTGLCAQVDTDDKVVEDDADNSKKDEGSDHTFCDRQHNEDENDTRHSEISKPMDRDRVADILKKYSLYDDDDESE